MVATTTNELRYAPSTVNGQPSLSASLVGKGKRILKGYAVVYNVWSQPLETTDGKSFVETILPGAAREAVKQPMVGMYAHQPSLILARTPDTLRVWEDSIGVAFELDLPDTTLGNDLWELIQRKVIGGMSFHLGDAKSEWRAVNGQKQRIVSRIGRIPEITITPYPAYPQTSIEQVAERPEWDDKTKERMQRLERLQQEMQTENMRLLEKANRLVAEAAKGMGK